MAHVSAADRRPQLVRAAIDVMLRDGVAAASTRAIAQQLGVAQATVHYVYGTKDELYRAVIAQLTAELSDRVLLAPVPAGATFREIVAVYAKSWWATVNDDPDAYQLLQELCVLALRSPGLRPRIGEYQSQLDAAVERTLKKAAAQAGLVPARPMSEVSRFFFAAFDGLVAQRLNRGYSDVRDDQFLGHVAAATASLAESPAEARLEPVQATAHRATA